MKLVTFTYLHRTRVGVWVDDRIHMTTWNYDMLRLIHSGIKPQVLNESVPVADVEFHEPFVPGQMFGIGRNYAAHAEELNNAIPERPLIFSKLHTSVIGPDETISWSNEVTEQVDYEGELAVIIGKTARNTSEGDALSHVYGYTIANDVSARDLQDSDGQWVRAKGLDTFCPFGPCIVTRDEIPDPQDLTVQTVLNDDEMQNGSTGLMLFKIAYLIAYMSKAFTLQPGDTILTGTPKGVGKAQKPPRFLKTGDIVQITIDPIGTLRNTCQEV